MATIREQQLQLLQTTNSENIEFQVYDKDGVAKSNFNQTKNVLVTIPNSLQPINQNFSIEYLRPLKYSIKKTETKDIHLINKNPNFRYDKFNWDIDDNDTPKIARIIQPSKLYYNVNPISGLSCLEQTQVTTEDKTNHLIKNLIAESPIVNGMDIEISFHYYAQSFITFPGISHKFYISVGVDTTSNNTVDKMLNFETNKFEIGTFSNDEYFKRIEVNEFNKWVKYKTIITSANFDVDNIKLEVKLFRASTSSSGSIVLSSISKVFIDAFYITQKKNIDKLVSTKTKGSIFNFEGDDVIVVENTGSYEIDKTFNSDEFDSNDINYIQPQGNQFGRKDRIENLNRTLDKLILQETLNDFRSSVKRYEGDFYRNDSVETPVSFFNKIWVNFGETTMQDSVAAIIDSMEYNVKANTYNIIMHLPNQDDDVTTYDTYRYE